MSRSARIVTIAGLLGSVTSVMILHVVRTDLSPISTRLSEYANGSYGWMMTLAFIALSIALTTLGASLWVGRKPDVIAWIFLATALLAAAGTMLSAMFRTGASEISETIHSLASATGVVAVVALALAYSLTYARNPLASSSDRVGIGFAGGAAFLAAISPVLHNTRFTGLSQRLLWASLIAWLLMTSWRQTRGVTVDDGGGAAKVAISPTLRRADEPSRARKEFPL